MKLRHSKKAQTSQTPPDPPKAPESTDKGLFGGFIDDLKGLVEPGREGPQIGDKAPEPPKPVQPSGPMIGQTPQTVPPGTVPGGMVFYIGVEYVEMAYEWLNSMAPTAKIKMKLSEIQKKNLEIAFYQIGLTINNPWVVILAIIVPPTLLFCLINYEELKKNFLSFKKDLMTGLGKFKKKVEDKVHGNLPSGHPDKEANTNEKVEQSKDTKDPTKY